MGKSIERHKLYRCYWCSIDLHWRRVKTDEEHGEVVCVGCPICERPVSELEIETVDIDEVFEGQDPKKEGEALIPPKPSWLYYCFDCGRYVPWNKVEAVIRKGKIILYRCPTCGEEIGGEETAATWLDQQELAKSSGYKNENYAGEIRSFVFRLEGDPCPECGSWPFPCRAEIGYPLRCARCGVALIDFLCWFCQNGKDVSEPDCCTIKHVTERVTFCLSFKQSQRTKI